MTLWEAGYHLPPADQPAPAKAIEPAKVVPKGHCKHCGRKVGKGLWRHEKACGGAK